MLLKKWFSFLFFLLLSSVWLTVVAQTPHDSIALARASWTELHRDRCSVVLTTSVRLFESPQSISLIRLSKGASLSVLQLEGCSITSEAARAAKAKNALNGSYFNVKTCEPSTYVKVKNKSVGRTLGGELFRVDAAVAIKGRRVHILPFDSVSAATTFRSYPTVLAGGPLLLSKGVKRSFPLSKGFFARHPRTALGITGSGEILMLVADGRLDMRAAGMTLDELTFVMQQLGAVDATNLDGGGSSTLWNNHHGVINHPSDNRVYDHYGERFVSNIIISK